MEDLPQKIRALPFKSRLAVVSLLVIGTIVGSIVLFLGGEYLKRHAPIVFAILLFGFFVVVGFFAFRLQFKKQATPQVEENPQPQSKKHKQTQKRKS